MLITTKCADCTDTVPVELAIVVDAMLADRRLGDQETSFICQQCIDELEDEIDFDL